MELQQYGPGHIEAFLINYDIFVRDLPEMAADWPHMDAEERGHHGSLLLQTWGNRKVLGTLFKAGCLQEMQETRLEELDRALLAQADHMAFCFGLDLSQLLAIFRWGTPLAASQQTVRLAVDPAVLERLAVTLAPAFSQ